MFMPPFAPHQARTPGALPKAPTGIKGLDAVTGGGLQRDGTTALRARRGR